MAVLASYVPGTDNDNALRNFINIQNRCVVEIARFLRPGMGGIRALAPVAKTIFGAVSILSLDFNV
jgi:hypothetical protein